MRRRGCDLERRRLLWPLPTPRRVGRVKFPQRQYTGRALGALASAATLTLDSAVGCLPAKRWLVEACEWAGAEGADARHCFVLMASVAHLVEAVPGRVKGRRPHSRTAAPR